MPGVAGHLVRRGLQATHRGFRGYQAAGNDDAVYRMPTWGVVLLLGTLVLFYGLILAVRYYPYTNLA